MSAAWGTLMYRTSGIIALAMVMMPAANAGQEPAAMPVSQQNELVQRYCAVCHDDNHRNGGLSLQHFDAAKLDPTLAAMMLSKLKSGAMGAAGLGVPDKPTQDAFQASLTAKSAGADQWSFSRAEDPATKTPLMTASIVRDLAPGVASRTQELYRLTLTCRAGSRDGEMALTWAPQPAVSGNRISVAVDGKPAVVFTVEGKEKMGNGAKTPDGADVTAGPAATVLYSTRQEKSRNLPMLLPAQTMVVRNVLAAETVAFPFDSLPQQVRQELSACFAAAPAGQ